MISRRRFVEVALLLCANAPTMARAQRSGKAPIVAIVLGTPQAAEMAGPIPRTDIVRVFLQRMRELGWEDGRNIVIERHSAEAEVERARAIFADLAARKVDVIVTAGNVGAALMPEEALRATRSIPIVFVGGGADPVARGLIASFSRPGGNVTGFVVTLGLEFVLKRLEVLKEIVPGIKRVAVLTPKADFDANVERMRSGLAKLGITVLLAQVETPEDYEGAFAAATSGRADAMYVSNVSLNRTHRQRIVALAAKYRLPAEYFFRESVEDGGLAAYGVDLLDLSRRAAGYADRILRGANPGDLPVELPSKFELVINLKTARALGIKIPQPVLLRATNVIE